MVNRNILNKFDRVIHQGSKQEKIEGFKDLLADINEELKTETDEDDIFDLMQAKKGIEKMIQKGE